MGPPGDESAPGLHGFIASNYRVGTWETRKTKARNKGGFRPSLPTKDFMTHGMNKGFKTHQHTFIHPSHVHTKMVNGEVPLQYWLRLDKDGNAEKHKVYNGACRADRPNWSKQITQNADEK